MNRGCVATAAVLFVSLGCEIAVAAETEQNKDHGFYVGASVSRVEHEAKGEGQILVAIGQPFGALLVLQPDQVRIDDTDAGWNVTLGYQINKYVSAELAYYDFGTASVTEHYSANLLPAPLNITVRSSIEAFGPGVSLLGTLPLTSSLQIFARGGMLFVDEKIGRQDASFRASHRSGDEIWMAGAGMQWSFAKRWTTRLEYQLSDDVEAGNSVLVPSSGTSKIEQASLSVLFDF